MKCLKKVLVSALISASLCSNITKAMSAAGWAGIVTAGLAVTGGVAAGIGFACSGKNGEEKNSEKESIEEELHTVEPVYVLVTDEPEGKILLNFFGKYYNIKGPSLVNIKVNEEIKDKVVEVKFWDSDSKEYKTVEGPEVKDKVDLGMLDTVCDFLSRTEKRRRKISCDGFKYGVSFGLPMDGIYNVFVSDDHKFIKVLRTNDGHNDDESYVTFKID